MGSPAERDANGQPDHAKSCCNSGVAASLGNSVVRDGYTRTPEVVPAWMVRQRRVREPAEVTVVRSDRVAPDALAVERPEQQTDGASYSTQARSDRPPVGLSHSQVIHQRKISLVGSDDDRFIDERTGPPRTEAASWLAGGAVKPADRRCADVVTVPDIVGMTVDEGRRLASAAGVVLANPDPDGPPLGAQTWPGVWTITHQSPVEAAVSTAGTASPCATGRRPMADRPACASRVALSRVRVR